MKRFFAVVLIFGFLFSFRVNALSLSAKSAIVISGDNGEVVFEKNSRERLSMASTTKIMTGLLLCEYGQLEREIIVTKEMVQVEGSSMGLLPGDRVTLHDLLYGLMLSSGNDAANVIAHVLGGSVKCFVAQMNNKAKELGLSNTNFATPSGLDACDHYTTAYDLARLSYFAMKNETFREVVSTEKAVLNYGNPPYKRSLSNHNKMLKMYDGAVGIKTGFTKKSGRCLVSAAKRDGKFVIAVTLNAPSDWEDHRKMLDYGLDAIKQTEVSPLVNNYNLPVINGEYEALTVKIEPLKINSLETENIDCKIELPKFIYAPIKKGDVIGKAVYYRDGETLDEVELLAGRNIEIKNLRKTDGEIIFENIKHIFLNI